MIIVGLAILIILVVCALHSYTRKDAPREPFSFYIDLERIERED